MCPFLQDLWWKHQYFSIEIKLPYLCGYEPCVAAAPSFHFTADCSHCFFKLHTAPWDKLVCLKYSEGCLPEKSTSSVKNVVFNRRKQISTVCLDADRKVFSSPLLETRTAGWTPPNAGDSLDLPLSSAALLSFCLDFGTLHTLSINWKHLCTFKKWNNISTRFSIACCTHIFAKYRSINLWKTIV